MEQNFPPNSAKAKEPKPDEEKKIERVTSGEATRRKKSLTKKFKGTFFGGDGRTALDYMVFNVLIPAAKDAMVDAASQGFERLIFGESRGRRPGGRSGVNPVGHVQYNRFSTSDRPTAADRGISRRARSRFDFDEIVLESRTEAEEVVDRLFDLVSRYGSATVADLYELVGLKSTHTDFGWGWRELRGAGVSRIRGGYLLDLPEPEPIKN
jgi:hypothetical protein